MARDGLDGLKLFLKDLVAKGREDEALGEAFRWGLVKEAKEMLDGGCDINCRIYKGSTPLMYASSGHAVKTARLAQKRGANATLIADDGCNALHALFMSWATDKNSLPILKILLEMGADPTAVMADGKTALDHAKEKECTACVALLIDAIEQWRKRTGEGPTREDGSE